MPSWITNTATPMPVQFNNAYRLLNRKIILDRYRSRTSVTDEEIKTAFTWTQLEDIAQGAPLRVLKYITRALPRGTSAAEAVEEAFNYIANSVIVNGINIITINSYTNAAAESELYERLAAHEHYEELNVRTLVTTAPNHRIKVYKETAENYTKYVVITNLYNTAMVFKVAAAISLDLNYIPALSPALQEGLLEGNAEKVYTALNAYYAEYEALRRQREMEQAIQQLEVCLAEAGLERINRTIQNLNNDAAETYEKYKEIMNKLKDAQAQFLLCKMQGSEEFVRPAVQFLNSCKNNITYMRANNNTLTVVYTTPLVFWDVKHYNLYTMSTRTNAINSMTPALQALFKEIFKDRTIQLMIESGFEIDFRYRDISYKDARDCLRTTAESLHGVPNPHHHYYNCWGDNKVEITKALANMDYIKALTQTFAAIGGINLTDTAVVNRLCSNVMADYKHTNCLKYKATGEVISIAEYERRFNNVSN